MKLLKKIVTLCLCLIMAVSLLPTTVKADDDCNHQWSEWIVDFKPECSSTGLKHRVCLICGDYEDADIPATGIHNWSEWRVWDSPDCVNVGIAERYCEECGKEEYKTLPKTGKHQFTAWYITKYPTIFKAGVQTRQCIVCGYKQNKSYPKLKAKVTLNKKSVSVKRKKSYTIKLKTWSGQDKVTKWKSSNKNISIKQSKNKLTCKITGKKKGKATVTVYMKSGVKATCKVTIK